MKRSPNYPAVGLSEALEKVRVLFGKEHDTEVAPEVAVGHLGYTGLNGPARSLLSALKKFGLITEGKHGLRVSELAIQILHPDSEQERIAAIREAAMRPELFRQLGETHLKASDDAIVNHLIKRQFSAAGAAQALAAFRDTFTLAKLDSSEYIPSLKEGEPSMAPSTSAPIATQPVSSKSTAQPNVFDMKIPYGDTQLVVKIEVSGDRLFKSHLAKVRKYLELAEDDLQDEG